ncbi:MAG: hypothetical protein JJE44_02075 [Flavobacteriaceae bacterium]|nr:hypothetical protein [Flavobacteriaceae bacterium]
MNWIFKHWKRNLLKKSRSLDFKLWLESDAIISSAVEKIQIFANGCIKEVKAMRVELHQLKANLKETYFLTDHWGNKSELKQPAFTKDEVARCKMNNWAIKIVIVLFILSEIVLYVLISGNLVGFLGLAGNIALSIVFALFLLLCYSKSLTFIIRIFEAREKYRKGLLSKSQLQRCYVELIGAIIMLILGTLFLFYAGLSRTYLIEGANSAVEEGLSNSAVMKEVIEKGGKATAMLAMIFTFAMAFLLAFLKKDHHDATVKLAAFNAWKKNVKRQEAIVEKLNVLRASITNKEEMEIEMAQQLGYDLMRIFKSEVDDSNRELYEMYKKERSSFGQEINLEQFNKYKDISMVDNRLLAFGIKNRIGIVNLYERYDDLFIKEQTSLDNLYLSLPERQTLNGDKFDSSEIGQKNQKNVDNVQKQIDSILN